MKKIVFRSLFTLIINLFLLTNCYGQSGCLKELKKGNFVRVENGETYTLVDSTGLYLYTRQKMSSPYGPTNKLYLATRKSVKYAYFSETKCGDIFPLRYDRLKKVFKNKYPEFIKDINELDDRDLIKPNDSLNKTPKVNIIYNKYKKK